MLTKKTANNPIEVVELYFDAFNRNDLEALVTLFTQEGVVKASSQNYASLEPAVFYQKVFEMTESKSVTIHSIAIDRDNDNFVIVNFDYVWSLNDGSKKHFVHAFDRFEIDLKTNKITSLVINLGPSIV